jgi:hypothetical protein
MAGKGATGGGGGNGGALAAGTGGTGVAGAGGGSGGTTGGTGGSGGASGSAGTSGGAGGTPTDGGAAGAQDTGGTSGTGSGSAGMPTGGSAGKSGDPCATALYCDDFESYDTKPDGKWSLKTSSGSVDIDTTEHVSGTKSVKFTTQAGGSTTAFMRIQDASIFPLDGNVLYGRMRFRLESAPTESVHWTIIQGFGTVTGQTYHANYRYGGQHPITDGSTFVGSQMMANYDTPDWYSDKSTPGSDCWHHANQRVIPTGKWVCIEWKFDGPNNGMQLWLDGTLADDLTVVGHGDGCVNADASYTWAAPTFSALDLGWESYQTDAARTAYIDDVAISTTQIGCD